MASALWRVAVSASAATVAASTTTYTYLAAGGNISFNTTEANRQVVQRSAGAGTRFELTVIANNRGASTARPRINGADGNGVVSVGASTTGLFISTGTSDTIASGDLLAAKVSTGAGGSQLTVAQIAWLFGANSNTVSRLINTNTGAGAFSSVNSFWPIVGNGSSGAEAAIQATFPVGGTLKNAAMVVSANTASGGGTVSSRIGGSTGNIAVSISASTTGTFEDTSNTDSVSAGALVNWSAIASGAGSITTAFVADFESTANQWILGCGGSQAVSATASVFSHVCGAIGSGASETSSVQGDADEAMTLSKLSVSISTNTVSATSTASTRVNGAAGGQAASITASTTGQFQDASGSDVLAQSDVMGLQMAAGATGTSLTWRNAITVATAPSTGGPFPFFFDDQMTGGLNALRGGMI